MSRLLVLLAAAALLAPTAFADEGADKAASRDEREARGDEPRKDDPDDDDDAGDDDGRKSPTAEIRSSRSGQGPSKAIGSFEVTSPRFVDGEFVDFTWSPTGVSNVTAGGLALFGAQSAGGGTGPSSARTDGSRVKIRTPGFELKAHDNPNAIFDFEAEGTLTLTFPAGTTLALSGDRVLVTYADGTNARVFGKDLTVVGTTLTTREDATFMLDAKKGAFDVHRAEISNAIAKDHIGAEVTIGRPEGDEGKLREDVVEFGNVTVTTLAQQGNVTLIVSGHGFDGRVIVVNVDPWVFGQRNREDFVFLFDNASIESASSLVDALDPDDDGLAPEYYFVQTDDGYQVLLTVPHYSVHTFTIAGIPLEITPSVAMGIAAGAALVAVGVAVLFRSPKRS